MERERIKHGWTQDEVADKIGVARSTYSNYENGHREPDLNTIQKLAELYGVSIDYLLTGRNYNRNISSNIASLVDVAEQLTDQQRESLTKFLRDMTESQTDTGHGSDNSPETVRETHEQFEVDVEQLAAHM
ncbi:MAG: helix-turn-helix domain-containing protein, partial [Alicyclobacillus sp.]|nr:helix-turn-helix domain-containing protein [Alicyclobacillus sp.]